jgi:hypothetical protein
MSDLKAVRAELVEAGTFTLPQAQGERVTKFGLE